VWLGKHRRWITYVMPNSGNSKVRCEVCHLSIIKSRGSPVADLAFGSKWSVSLSTLTLSFVRLVLERANAATSLSS